MRNSKQNIMIKVNIQISIGLISPMIGVFMAIVESMSKKSMVLMNYARSCCMWWIHWRYITTVAQKNMTVNTIIRRYSCKSY